MSFKHDKRIILYPHYLDSTKTVAEGRRIPKDKAAPNPNVLEMMDCLKFLKLPADIEDKHYPRDWFIRGRVRVQLKNEDGSPVNPEVPNRMTLMLKIAELVPKHPSRRNKPAGTPAVPAAADAAGPSSAGGSSSAAGSGKSSKKKGKK